VVTKAGLTVYVWLLDKFVNGLLFPRGEQYISITPPSFMKFCPAVPEICRGRRSCRKERKENNNNNKGGSNGVGFNIESYEKVEISYINVDNF
jgi:hypothetical protein